jgi:Ran-binding protein 1
MFRFVEASKEWKERGTGVVILYISSYCCIRFLILLYMCAGDVRFLRHKDNKKIRVLMRAEKTLRVRANHPR